MQAHVDWVLRIFGTQVTEKNRPVRPVFPDYNDYLAHILLFYLKKIAAAVVHTYADQTSVLPTAKFYPVLNK